MSHPTGPLPVVPPRAASWRPELSDALVETASTGELRRRLAQPGTLVVTTGQQPGLFTGPVYTVHKALATAAVARVLAARWQRDVVPLFWIAGDDHDFAEASVAHWTDAAGELVEWRLPPRPALDPQRPLTAEVLPAVIDDGLRLLENSLPAGPDRDRTLAWLRRHYHAGDTLHAAYRGALSELVAPFGVGCIDPTVPAFKRAQAPWLRRALQSTDAIDAALARLPTSGSGIDAGDGASLVFVVTDAGRERLMRDGTGFRTRRSRQQFSEAQLDALLEREPERFSANVLLRPVVESALLPTVAYVAGPGELIYLRDQAATVYPLLDTPAQVPVPRWSGTVIPRWAERLLGRLHLTAAAVLQDDGQLGQAILERDFPGDARQALDALGHQLDRSGGVITAAGKRIDPVLERAIDNRMGRMRRLAGDIEQVLQRHLRRRTDIAYAQYSRLAQGLRPLGSPQERVITAANYLARYGDDWLASIARETEAWANQLPETGA